MEPDLLSGLSGGTGPTCLNCPVEPDLRVSNVRWNRTYGLGFFGETGCTAIETHDSFGVATLLPNEDRSAADADQCNGRL